jgi:hypothetical protein
MKEIKHCDIHRRICTHKHTHRHTHTYTHTHTHTAANTHTEPTRTPQAVLSLP